LAVVDSRLLNINYETVFRKKSETVKLWALLKSTYGHKQMLEVDKG